MNNSLSYNTYIQIHYTSNYSKIRKDISSFNYDDFFQFWVFAPDSPILMVDKIASILSYFGDLKIGKILGTIQYPRDIEELSNRDYKITIYFHSSITIGSSNDFFIIPYKELINSNFKEESFNPARYMKQYISMFTTKLSTLESNRKLLKNWNRLANLFCQNRGISYINKTNSNIKLFLEYKIKQKHLKYLRKRDKIQNEDEDNSNEPNINIQKLI